MQTSVFTSIKLGSKYRYGQSLAKLYWKKFYPGQRGTPYWSVRCTNRGQWDLYPKIDEWP
jgi:hypothetical protein